MKAPRSLRFAHPSEALELVRRPASTATLESVQMLLQAALEVERFTIPPYLTALYSMKENTNLECVSLFRSVVVEEMLHMALVCNVLNAIGGLPDLTVWGLEDDYPNPLPHSSNAWSVNIGPFAPASIATFCQVELPAPAGSSKGPGKYNELGQFYLFIIEALALLDHSTPGGIFTGDRAWQVGPEHYYSAGGMLLPVIDLQSAIEALNVIVVEGGGSPGSVSGGDEAFRQPYELAHYYRFASITGGKMYQRGDRPGTPTGRPLAVDWNAAANMAINLTLGDLQPWPDIQQVARSFNTAWGSLLATLNTAFRGRPDVLQSSVTQMFDLKYRAQALMRLPLKSGYFAGPVWNLAAGR